jgi:DNA-binding MarR family transcriptional regulator
MNNNVPHPRPARPVPITMAMNRLRRMVTALDLTPTEARVVWYLLYAGRDLRWTMYKGNDLAVVLGNTLNIHPTVMRRVIPALIRRDWVMRNWNEAREQFLEFTPKFIDDVELAWERLEVRRILGPQSWMMINGNNDVADQIIADAATMPHQRHNDSVRAAARKYIEHVQTSKSTRDESLHNVQRIVAKSATNRCMKIIDGERK